MKRILVIFSMLVWTLAAGTALAAPVTVDFSSLGIETIDITIKIDSPPYTQDGVTFRYDDLGSGADFALVDATGIWGSTGGGLLFDFSEPVAGLKFDFSLLASSDVTDGLLVTLKKEGADVADLQFPATFAPYDPTDPTLGGEAFGSFLFSGALFDQATMFFSLEAPLFSVANIGYETATAVAPVPEPATLLLLSSGLLGLSWRLRQRG